MKNNNKWMFQTKHVIKTLPLERMNKPNRINSKESNDRRVKKIFMALHVICMRQTQRSETTFTFSCTNKAPLLYRARFRKRCNLWHQKFLFCLHPTEFSHISLFLKNKQTKQKKREKRRKGITPKV